MLSEGMSPGDEGRTTTREKITESVVDGESDQVTSIYDTRRIVTFCVASYFFIMTAFIVPLACVSTVILIYPLIFINMKLFLLLENRLCRFVNDHWVAASAYCGLKLDEYGDDISSLSEERVLFLSNHLGLVDHFIIMNALHNKGSVSGRWMWVIYNIWKYTPLGAMWTSHGNFFVNGGRTKRERLLGTFRKHLGDYFWSWKYGWVVMYPEGSRLFIIRESASRFADKEGLSPLSHCAYPRTGAAHAVMQVCAPSIDNSELSQNGGGPPIDYIIDATLGYPKGVVPDLGNAILGEWTNGDGRLAIHYKIHKSRPEWSDEEKLKEFLYECYREKDTLLEEYYEKDSFPGKARHVQVNTWTILASQLFWISVYYIHYVLWIRPSCVYILSSISSFFF